MCSDHHRAQHAFGEVHFAMRHGIDMKAVATDIAKKSRNRDIRICAGRRAEEINPEELET